jgi:luciferase family oxidoreductase group 1
VRSMIPFSILDLVRVRQNSSIRTAIEQSAVIAQAAEKLGYKRIWIAEHHGMAGIASAATSIVIAHLAAATKTIRVGAGGIMLPNHAPLLIAEQFGTLAHLYPGRIDLGVGRAPGSDQRTSRVLRVDPMAAENFPNDVLELQDFLGPKVSGRFEATPGSGTEIPLWILGSSLFGSSLAAQFGLPYAFASHFAPDSLEPALAQYRQTFKPSKQLDKSYAMAGINIIAADTLEEAEFLASTQTLSIVNLFRGERGLSQPPVHNVSSQITAVEQMRIQQFFKYRFIGTVETLKKDVSAFIKRTKVDELMVVSDVFDLEKRRRSFEIIAEVGDLIGSFH